jgi:hypothetical protein
MARQQALEAGWRRQWRALWEECRVSLTHEHVEALASASHAAEVLPSCKQLALYL